MNARKISPQRIRSARNGTSQAEIAFRMRSYGLKTTERHVRRWETGETTPHSSAVVPLAQALGVDVEQLFEPAGDDDADAEDEQQVLLRSAYELDKAGLYRMADDLRSVARSRAAEQRDRSLMTAHRREAREFERDAERRRTA